MGLGYGARWRPWVAGMGRAGAHGSRAGTHSVTARESLRAPTELEPSCQNGEMGATVLAVHSSPTHSFSKQAAPKIRLLEGIGVEGDAHAGTTVQHRSRVARDPSTPNLRQVHLIPAELFTELAADGFLVAAGELGENITTMDVDLLGLPVGTRLHVGEASIVVTGLRNPCRQIDGLQSGLMKRVVFTDDDGLVRRLTGVMGIVSRGGMVRPGEEITVQLPPEPHFPLTTV